jgi:Leucine-rich repeat (LRR) protein
MLDFSVGFDSVTQFGANKMGLTDLRAQIRFPPNAKCVGVYDNALTHFTGVVWPPKLTAVFISQNRLSSLSTLVLPDSVDHVFAGSNLITGLDDFCFSPRDLVCIDLSDNRIEVLDSRILQRRKALYGDRDRLERIDLSGNPVTRIYVRYSDVMSTNKAVLMYDGLIRWLERICRFPDTFLESSYYKWYRRVSTDNPSRWVDWLKDMECAVALISARLEPHHAAVSQVPIELVRVLFNGYM